MKTQACSLLTCDPALRQFLLHLDQTWIDERGASAGFVLDRNLDDEHLLIKSDADWSARLQVEIDKWHDKNTYDSKADEEAEREAELARRIGGSAKRISQRRGKKSTSQKPQQNDNKKKGQQEKSESNKNQSKGRSKSKSNSNSKSHSKINSTNTSKKKKKKTSSKK